MTYVSALKSGVQSFAIAVNRAAKESSTVANIFEKAGISVPTTVKKLKAHPSYADSFTKSGKLNKKGKQSVKKLCARLRLAPDASFKMIMDEIVSWDRLTQAIRNKYRK